MLSPPGLSRDCKRDGERVKKYVIKIQRCEYISSVGNQSAERRKLSDRRKGRGQSCRNKIKYTRIEEAQERKRQREIEKRKRQFAEKKPERRMTSCARRLLREVHASAKRNKKTKRVIRSTLLKNSRSFGMKRPSRFKPNPLFRKLSFLVSNVTQSRAFAPKRSLPFIHFVIESLH